MKPLFRIVALVTLLAFSSCEKETTKPAEPEVNYTNFKILSVQVSAIPFIGPDNSSWDFSNGPDVFFKIETDNGTVLINGNNSRYGDVGPANLPLTWNLVNAHQITNLNVTHIITLYDYDTPDPDDRIGYVGFTMAEHKSGYPKTVTKSLGDVTIKISGEWY